MVLLLCWKGLARLKTDTVQVIELSKSMNVKGAADDPFFSFVHLSHSSNSCGHHRVITRPKAVYRCQICNL